MEQEAHRAVAQLSLYYLDDNAKQQLAERLGARWQEEWVALAASVQPSLALPGNENLLPFQFTLFDETDTEFNVVNNCPNNRCSVAALLESKRVLMLDSFSNKDKTRALAYLLHYGLQIHNPINTGFKSDQGGQNTYLKDSELQPVNLAWIWNYDLYRRMNEHWFTLAQKLHRDIDSLQVQQWLVETDPVQWAFESHLVAREFVYPLAVEGRYSAKLSADGRHILRLQMQKAAVRIAGMVNEAFEPSP